MTDTSIDYANALQIALYDRLRPGLIGHSKVYQHVPDGTAPPVTVIGDMNPADQGVKGAVFDRWSVRIDSVTKGPAKSACSALQALVRGLLDGWTPDATDEVRFGTFYFENAEAALIPDEEMYFGSQIFTVTTEPA